MRFSLATHPSKQASDIMITPSTRTHNDHYHRQSNKQDVFRVMISDGEKRVACSTPHVLLSLYSYARAFTRNHMTRVAYTHFIVIRFLSSTGNGQ